MTVVKSCSACGVDKPQDGFYPSVWRQTNGRCKECFNQYPSVANSKAYYAATRPVRLAAAKRYRAANRGKVNADSAAWRKANPARVKENWRSWYAANAEQQREKAAAWSEAHPEYARRRAASESERERKRQWKAANPAKVVAATRRRRAMKLNATIDAAPVTVAGVDAKAAYWGNACWMCRGAYEEIDHVKPLAVGGLHVLANLRPICAPCNRRKSATWPIITQPAIPDIQEAASGP